MKSALARSVFGEGGRLARTYPGFELRLGQIRMSESITAAIAGSEKLCVEAPTGTGKTFAYLVPAIESGRKVVISTGTRNLQDQLFFKDLPQLERALDREVPAALMKGRDNYLCIKRAREFDAEPLFDEVDEGSHYAAVRSWAKTTESGERSDLAELPERLRFWSRINARADTCLGQRCPDFEECFLTRMRRKAAEAQIVIVNHHLLLADMVLRGHAFGQVIPDYSVLVLDEAHSLEEAATAHLGRSISAHQVQELAGDVESACGASLEGMESARRQINALRTCARSFFGMLQREEGRFPLQPFRRDALWVQAATDLRGALARGGDLPVQLGLSDAEDPSVAALSGRAREMAQTLDLILSADRGPEPDDEMVPPVPDMVAWGEMRGRNVTLQASPIDVSGPLREMLFSRTPSVILTSATLTIDRSFAFVRRRLGLDEARELMLESPFDPQRQAVLYVPRNFPEPRHEGFMTEFLEQARALLEVTSGRAFLLFTSYANLERAKQALIRSAPWPIMAQGDAARHALLERFRATPNSVLLGTSSFWHGVDVQGEQLSLVIIDKLPFDAPGDPVVAARIDAIRRGGGDPFLEYQVPSAVIDLKQGLGRLLRSRRDRGILAVMDARLLSRGYGRVFLNSLPPFPVVHDLDTVRTFFAQAA